MVFEPAERSDTSGHAPASPRDDGASANDTEHVVPASEVMPRERTDDACATDATTPEPARSTRPDAPPRGFRWRPLRRALSISLALVIGTPVVIAFRVWSTARQDDRTASDAILVLGAAQFNGRPSSVLEARLTHALDLYRQGVAPRIVTVGGNKPGDDFTEASTGRHWLSDHGVPMSALHAVPTGNDTRQSMVAVGKEFKDHEWSSAVIVTDPWHELRSTAMARDNGITARPSPTRSGPAVSNRETESQYIIRETGGYLYYEIICHIAC